MSRTRGCGLTVCGVFFVACFAVASTVGQTINADGGNNRVNVAYSAIFFFSGVSIETANDAPDVNAGYARMLPETGSDSPAGLAIFGYRRDNVLVSEAGVPASGLLRSGRIYAAVSGPVNTGVAMDNPNDEAATVSFYFTDEAGNNFGSGAFSMQPRTKIAAFLNEVPFKGASPLSGSFTFNSSLPIAAVALRGFINERSDFLITTLAVADLAAPPVSDPLLLPQFAAGGGWTSQILLTNPGNTTLSGTIQFLSSSGAPAAVTIGGRANDSFPYSLPPRTAQRLQTEDAGGSTVTGSVQITPGNGMTTPVGEAIFSFRDNGVTVTEAGVSTDTPGLNFRVYAEVSGAFGAAGSIRTGLAISNASTRPASITLELENLDGSSTGLSGALFLPGNGHISTFLTEIPGFASLPMPFKGVLRMSARPAMNPFSGIPPISVIGLRGRYNERNEFLITTTPPTNEDIAPPPTAMFFPQIVDSGGYSTEFTFFRRRPDQSISGMIELLSSSGAPMNVRFK